MGIIIRTDLGNSVDIPEGSGLGSRGTWLGLMGITSLLRSRFPGVGRDGITVKLLNDEPLVKAEGGGRKYLLIKEFTVDVARAEYRGGLLIIRLPIKGVSIGVG